MINLIPPKAKKGLLIEYWTRVCSTWFNLWSFALFASAGILLPVYVLINSQVTVYEESAAEASLKVASFENVSVALVQASLRSKTILDESALPVISEYMSLFESLQGQDITINKIRLDRSDEGLSPALVEGAANNRQSLASFKDRLLAEKQIISVDLPISNLAQDRDIQFSITVTFANNTEI